MMDDCEIKRRHMNIAHDRSACRRSCRSAASWRQALLLLVASFAVVPRCSLALTGQQSFASGAQQPAGETVEEAVCRLIETAAHAHGLPVAFLTRLIWQESSFRASVISPAGAQGIAQFMPRTANERGLADPFDPEKAIPEAAGLLAELAQRFGNFGLAAAAYNGGPARVADWLAGRADLPAETRAYVLQITGRAVEDWAADGASATIADSTEPGAQSCLQLAIAIRRVEPGTGAGVIKLAPWGVQLAGSFSKASALASFARTRRSYSAILGNIQPIIIGTRLLSRGTRPFYRVRVAEQSRSAADLLCNKIQRVGGACAVLAN
jgi:hypothetical protein